MIRNIVRSLRASYLYLEVVWRLDVLLAVLAGRRNLDRGGHHVLLAATGGGNIGDQAMLESFIQNADGPLAIITSDVRSLRIPEEHVSRISVHEIPNLVKGIPVLRLNATLRLIKILREAQSYSVIGADIMDGVYSPEQSVARMSSINCALRMGIDSRILGFSWSAKAGSSAKSSMRRLNSRARIYARDPESLSRLHADGVTKAELVADTVFSLETFEESPVLDRWIEGQRTENRKIAILNASGLISRKVDLTQDYVEIVRFLLDSGYSVMLLPHVIRRGDDDSDAINTLAESCEIEGAEVLEVTELLTPSQVKRLVSQIDLAVTGRMHLAVLALSAAVPTVTFGTQGKVEGLYKLVNLEAFCVSPEIGAGKETIALISSIHENPGAASDSITKALPGIVESSKINFVGLNSGQY